MNMKCSSWLFSVTTTTFLFLSMTAALSMLCFSLWLTSEGLTSYVETMKTKLRQEGALMVAPGATVELLEAEATQGKRVDSSGTYFDDTEARFSNSWYEIRKHRTRLLTRTKCLHHLFLIVLVSSSSVNYSSRMAIRRTWGTDSALFRKWKTVFLVGEGNNAVEADRITREEQIFGDIIQGDYAESFANKVFKVQSGFEWAAKYCNFHYLLKTDDDVFVNIHGLIDFLSRDDTPKTGFYYGHLMQNSPVLRSGVYAVSQEDHPEEVYKDYLSGGGYVLSEDLAVKFTAMFDVVKPLKIDDAYIGRLAADIGVRPISGENFSMYQTSCAYIQQMLLQRPVNQECMAKLFEESRKGILARQVLSDKIHVSDTPDNVSRQS